MLETYDKFIEDKVASLKAYVKALMDDFKTTLQSFEEDIAILKKTVMQWTPFNFEALPKFVFHNLRASMATEMPSRRISHGIWSDILRLLAS